LERRLRGDLIEAYKIIDGIERVDEDNFFAAAPGSRGLRGHNRKLFKPKCRTTARMTFFSSRVINDWNNLPQEVIGATSFCEYVQEPTGQELEGYEHLPHSSSTSTRQYKYRNTNTKRILCTPLVVVAL